MKIEKFVTGIISTNCYLVRDEETKRAVIIDPAACPSYLMSHIKSEGLQVEAILLTHGHFDHIMGSMISGRNSRCRSMSTRRIR